MRHYSDDDLDVLEMKGDLSSWRSLVSQQDLSLVTSVLLPCSMNSIISDSWARHASTFPCSVGCLLSSPSHSHITNISRILRRPLRVWVRVPRLMRRWHVARPLIHLIAWQNERWWGFRRARSVRLSDVLFAPGVRCPAFDQHLMRTVRRGRRSCRAGGMKSFSGRCAGTRTLLRALERRGSDGRA